MHSSGYILPVNDGCSFSRPKSSPCVLFPSCLKVKGLIFGARVDFSSEEKENSSSLHWLHSEKWAGKATSCNRLFFLLFWLCNCFPNSIYCLAITWSYLGRSVNVSGRNINFIQYFHRFWINNRKLFHWRNLFYSTRHLEWGYKNNNNITKRNIFPVFRFGLS